MFNPLSLFKKQQAPGEIDAKMMREFLTQMSKLSPTERQFVKKMLGNQLKQKLSPAQFDIAFKEMEPKLGADLKPEELQQLKKELRELLS